MCNHQKARKGITAKTVETRDPTLHPTELWTHFHIIFGFPCQDKCQRFSNVWRGPKTFIDNCKTTILLYFSSFFLSAVSDCFWNALRGHKHHLRPEWLIKVIPSIDKSNLAIEWSCRILCTACLLFYFFLQKERKFLIVKHFGLALATTQKFVVSHRAMETSFSEPLKCSANKLMPTHRPLSVKKRKI